MAPFPHFAGERRLDFDNREPGDEVPGVWVVDHAIDRVCADFLMIALHESAGVKEIRNHLAAIAFRDDIFGK